MYHEKDTIYYEVEEERVEWGTIPPEWRDEIDMPPSERWKWPYKNRRWAVRRIYGADGSTWGEPVDMFGQPHEAEARCKELNESLSSMRDTP